MHLRDVYDRDGREGCHIRIIYILKMYMIEMYMIEMKEKEMIQVSVKIWVYQQVIQGYQHLELDTYTYHHLSSQMICH